MLTTIKDSFQYLQARFGDERGATAVEYGLMVALIAVAIIFVVMALGGNLADLFGKVSNNIGGAANQGPANVTTSYIP